MKVCYITPYPLRSVSGVSNVVTQLCRGLKARNIDHIVITARLKDEVEKDQEVEAVEFDVSRIRNFRDILLGLRTFIHIIKNRDEIDLLHLHSPHMQPMMAAISGKVLGKPVIITIHGRFPKPRSVLRKLYFWFTTKVSTSLSDAITFVDEDAKKHYGVRKGMVIKNGIDTEIFSPDPRSRRETRSQMGLSEDDVVLIYIGRLAANKGAFDLLNVISDANKFTNRGIKLILVGSGEKDKISNKIRSLGIEKDVFLMDATSNVVPYYQVSDIFVLYSQFEGLPIVLLEASSCALAIISTRVGGIPDLVQDGENGFLLEHGDYTSLVNRTKLIAEDALLRKNIGDKARENVIENYNIDNMIDSYVNLYNIVLKEKRR